MSVSLLHTTAQAQTTPLCLDGWVSSGIQVGPDLRLRNDQFSLEIWFKRYETPSVPDYLHVLADIEWSGTFLARGSGLWVATDRGHWQVPAEVPVGQWTHVAFTFDGTILRAYVNGMLVGQVVADGTEGIDLRQYQHDNELVSRLGIGRAAFDGAPGTYGQMREFRLWSEVRTPQQIRDLMAQALPSRPPTLVAVWPLTRSPQALVPQGEDELTSLLTGTATFCSSPDDPLDFRRPIVTACDVEPNIFHNGLAAVEADQSLSYRVAAADNVSVAALLIHVDGVQVVQYILEPLTTSVDRSFDFPGLPAGNHSVRCTAIDHAGNSRSRVLGLLSIPSSDGFEIDLAVSPPAPEVGDTVTVTATATAAQGIGLVGMFGTPPFAEEHYCVGDGGNSVVCEFTATLSSNRPGAFEVSAYAAGTGGTPVSTVRTTRVLYATAPQDADGDGVPDSLERSLCTSPTDPDTDDDGLLDGWELFGLTHDDGRTVPLPSMGVHPCFKDALVHYIGEEQLEIRDSVFAHASNVVNRDLNTRMLWSRRIIPRQPFEERLFVDQAMSYFDVEQVAFGMDPSWTWTHNVVHAGSHSLLSRVTGGGGNRVTMALFLGDCACPVGRENPLGLNSALCRAMPECRRMSNEAIAATLVHELGHAAFYLGHGGSGVTTTSMSELGRSYVHPAFVGLNRMPHYRSEMNYLYSYGNVSCVELSDDHIIWSRNIEYATAAGGEINETDLSESPDAAWAAALRQAACPGRSAAAHPVVEWACPPEANSEYVLLA